MTSCTACCRGSPRSRSWSTWPTPRAASTRRRRTLLDLDDLPRLLRGDVGFTGPKLKLGGATESAVPVAAAVVVAKLRKTGDLAGLVLSESKTPNEADLRALIARIVGRMFCMEGGELGGENLDLPHIVCMILVLI